MIMSRQIAIRTIQHYMYCPHRWGLMEVGDAWAENAFITKANFVHQRVHDQDNHYSIRGRHVLTALSVYNDLEDYNIYGKLDCLELTPDDTGVNVFGFDRKMLLTIVEYKPTYPKNSDYNSDDLMQVFAQKVCVDYIFGGKASGVLYYADKKQRVTLPLDDNFDHLDTELRQYLREMRSFLEKGIIPEKRANQKCSGCSLANICLPRSSGLRKIRNVIENS